MVEHSFSKDITALNKYKCKRLFLFDRETWAYFNQIHLNTGDSIPRSMANSIIPQ